MKKAVNMKLWAILLPLVLVLVSAANSRAACTYSIAPGSRTHGYLPATNTVSVTTSNGCGWSVVKTSSWVTVLSGASGTGAGVVTYAVATNNTAADRGTVLMVDGEPFNITQHGCGVSFSPTNRNHGAGTTTNSVNVTNVAAYCSWAASTTNSWLHLVGGAAGTGNGAVNYTVDANPGGLARTGALMIDDQEFTVTQGGVNCTNVISIAPGDRTHGYLPATNTVSVTTSNGCDWSVVKTSSWVTVLSGANGTGTGVVRYAVATNNAAADRMTVLFIGGRPFELTQHGCGVSLSPTNRNHGPGAATNYVNVTNVAANCAWVVSNPNNWLFVISGGSGTGNRTMHYRVSANPSGLARTGMLRIDDQEFMVTQDGVNCTNALAIAPGSRTHGYLPATNTVSVTTSNGCGWNAVVTVPWITILSGASGTGTGVVTYAVATNNTAADRVTVLMVDGEPFNITQHGCGVSFSPTNRNHGAGTTTNSVNVTNVAAYCSWAASTTNSWLHLVGGAAGTGNGAVNYTVDANPGGLARTGALMIDDQEFTVTQGGVNCTNVISIAPGDRTHGYLPATNTVSVTTSNDCGWSVVKTSSWVTVLSGANGTGTGVVRYAVATNNTAADRMTVLFIGGRPFELTQHGCGVSLSPTNRNHGPGAATNYVNVTNVAANCAWVVSNPNSWLVLISGGSGTGNKTVNYRVLANPSALARAGMLRIDDQEFMVTQDGVNCTNALALVPGSRTHGYLPATNTVSVTTSNGCAWNAAVTVPWITILSGASGTGTGVVTYAVATNETAADRVTVLMVDGEPFNITQHGCGVSFSPTNRNHGAGTTTNSVNVTNVAAYCSWAASTTNSWLHLVGGAAGTGNGAVNYTVDANPSGLARTGALMIDDQEFTVTQGGVNCTNVISIVPGDRTHGYLPATNTVSVTTSNGCGWSVVKTSSWVTVLSGASGTGTGVVTYAVATNNTAADRMTVLFIGGRPFELTQHGCGVSLSPTNRNHGYGAATNHVNVTNVAANCAWVVSNPKSWLVLISGGSGTGNKTVHYRVLANPSGLARTGMLRIDDQEFMVTQDGVNCTNALAIAPGSRTHGYLPATNTVSVTTSNGCGWNAVVTVPWITILSGASGTGTGVVTYAVATNETAADRVTVLMVDEEPFNITQHGCGVSFSPTNRNHGYGATANSVNVTNVAAYCAWAASTTNSWLHLVDGAAGMGNGAVSYTLDANLNSTPRMAAVEIDGEIFTVNQAAAPCPYDLSSSEGMHSFGVESGVVSVLAAGGCTWAVTNTNTWISINSGATGTSNGSVTYTVATNPTALARSGALLIGSQVFPVTQAAFGCVYRLSTTNRMHGHGGGAYSVTVTAGATCVWAVSNANSWIHITSGLTGQGTGPMAYTVDANLNIVGRTGVVLIADQMLKVSQAAFNCTYKISPTNRVHGFAASAATVSVTANSNCVWSVLNSNAWITIVAGGSGMGNGTVSYSVAPNLTNASRAGFLMVEDQLLSITQSGATNGFGIQSIVVLESGAAKLRLAGAPAGIWQLQVSSDLTHWQRISEITNVTGVVEFTDPDAAFANERFYRAVQP